MRFNLVYMMLPEQNLILRGDYQKCAFVSAEALNGYSDSDILDKGNYKLIGSKKHTVFDLTEYNGSMPHKLEEGRRL